MPIHARSDVMGVTVSTDHGGCGVPHYRGDADRLVLDDLCGCGEFLVGAFPDQWSRDPSRVPLTPDEELASDVRRPVDRRVDEAQARLAVLEQRQRDSLSAGVVHTIMPEAIESAHRELASAKQAQAKANVAAAPVGDDFKAEVLARLDEHQAENERLRQLLAAAGIDDKGGD